MSNTWTLLRQALESPALRTLYVYGPPGIGKTYGAYRYGLEARPLFAVTLTEDTPAAELRGHYLPKGNEFVWQDGPAVKAMRTGGRLVLNEVSHAGADVLSILHAILESPDTARLTLPTGETVIPAPGFQVILTDNVAPSELPDALRDRFDGTVHVTTPSPEALAVIPGTLRPIVEAAARPVDGRAISLRAWDALSRLVAGGLELKTAGALVMGERWGEFEDSVRIALAVKPGKKGGAHHAS